MAVDDIELGMGKLTSMSTWSLSSPSTTTSKNLPPPPPPQYVSVPLPVKLSDEINEVLPCKRKTNYLLWKSFFIPILKYHDMLDLAEGRELCPPQFLDDDNDVVVENPAYTHWIKRDQLLLAWINASLTESLLHRFAGGCTSGRALWLSLENLLALKAEAFVKELKIKLDNLEIRTIEGRVYGYYLEDFADEAKKIADKLDAAGSPIDDHEFVSCVLQGLDRCECDELKRLTANIITNRHVPLTREQLLHELKRYQLSDMFPPSVLTVDNDCDKICHKIRDTICLVIYYIISLGAICLIISLLIYKKIHGKK